MKEYKFINTGKAVTLRKLIVSGDIADSGRLELYGPDGGFICRGCWYQDNILNFTERRGKATKGGTGLTVKFQFCE